MLSRSRKLRLESSDAERLLWNNLRGRRLNGFKFRRQYVIESYIVDFVCLETKLIIEADGGQHTDQSNYDARRTARLESLGYTVIRFWNNEILNQLQLVLKHIEQKLKGMPSPQPSPEGRGG